QVGAIHALPYQLVTGAAPGLTLLASPVTGADGGRSEAARQGRSCARNALHRIVAAWKRPSAAAGPSALGAANAGGAARTPRAGNAGAKGCCFALFPCL